MGRKSGKESVTKRAREVAEKRLIVEKGDGEWTAKSGSEEGAVHTVKLADGKLECYCGAGGGRGTRRHTHAVMPFRAKKAQKPKGNVVPSSPLAPTVVCPHCGGADNPIKGGKRKRKRRESAQRRPCKDCNRTFAHDPGFPGMHLPASIVRYAPLLHAMKLSAVETRLALLGAPKIAVSVHPDTVRRRRARCAKMARKFVRGMVVWSSGMWSVGEKFVRVDGKGQYVYVVMDATIKFVLDWEVTGDKLNGYDARGPRGRTGPRHIRDIHIRDECADNNAHERFNGMLGEGPKPARGPPDGDSSVPEARFPYHNFMRGHGGPDGATPVRRQESKWRGTRGRFSYATPKSGSAEWPHSSFFHAPVRRPFRTRPVFHAQKPRPRAKPANIRTNSAQNAGAGIWPRKIPLLFHQPNLRQNHPGKCGAAANPTPSQSLLRLRARST